MNWIVASGLMFLSSIVYYLIVKKAQVNRIDKRVYMVANFVIPTALFYISSLTRGYQIFIDIRWIVGILLSSVLFNYLGSTIAYVAMQEAPNAGYSLVIQKSYAIYTTIAAVYLFHADFSFGKFASVVLILLSTVVLSVQRGKKVSVANYRWVIYSVGAFLCFGSIGLFGKYFVSAGIKPTVLLFWIMLFTTVLSVMELVRSRKKITMTFSAAHAFLLLGIGTSVTFFYYFKQIAEVIAPNIGYVNAINAASNAFYTVIVALLFKDHLSWKKFVGVVGVTVGLVLLVLS